MEENEDDDFGFSNITFIGEQEVRVKVNKIPIVEYTPKQDNKFWFMNKEYTNDLNKNMKDINNELNLKKKKEQSRKNEIKYTQYRIDYLYSIEKYKECLDEVSYLKTLVKLKKKQDYTDDIIDTEIRCNFKLLNFDKVIELIKNIENTMIAKNSQLKDIHLIQILAQSLHLKNQINESRIQYHRCISLNHRIWEWWLNLSLNYLNISNLITKQNLNETTINFNQFFNQDKIKNEISFLNKVLAYRSLCHSNFLLSQSIVSKKKSFSLTNGFKQLEKMKLIIESIITLITTNNSNKEGDDEIISEELITLKLEQLKNDSNNNLFECKWLIEFKTELLKNDEDDQDEIQDREENPFTL